MKFLYYWFPCFNVAESNEIVSQLEDIHHNHPNNLKDVPAGGKKVSEVKVISTELFPKIMDRFFSKVEDVNDENFGFKLFKKTPNVAHLNYYSAKNLSEYPYHIDMANPGTCHDMKLTAIINLSRQNYKGGQFQFMFHEGGPTIVEELDNIGNVIVFPSFFLHKVTPVVEGERISLSIWFFGPNWK